MSGKSRNGRGTRTCFLADETALFFGAACVGAGADAILFAAADDKSALTAALTVAIALVIVACVLRAALASARLLPRKRKTGAVERRYG